MPILEKQVTVMPYFTSLGEIHVVRKSLAAFSKRMNFCFALFSYPILGQHFAIKSK